MTATILAFPTLYERDAAEFDRTGTNVFIRASDEAYALWHAVKVSAHRAALASRICAFTQAIDHLARYRPESLGDLVILDEVTKISLAFMPDVLRAIAGIDAEASLCSA